MQKLFAALRSPILWPWLLCTPAVVLRFWGLTDSPLWYDEAFTRLLAGLPIARLVAATAGDVHPPLYYLVVSLVGTSPLALRLPSAVFSSLALPVFWRLAEELGLTRSARLVGLALLAYHPVEVFYASEARMYAFLQLLVLCQFYAVFKRRWFLLGLFSFLVLYTHNYGLIYTAVVFLVGFLQALKRPRLVYRPHIDNELTGTDFLQLFLSVFIPGLLWLPWSAVLLRQMQAISEAYWIQPLSFGSILYALLQILGGFNVPDYILPLAWFAISAGLLILLLHGLKTKKLSLLAMAFGPLAIAVGISMVGRSVLLFRGLIGMLPPLAALAGSAIVTAKPRGRWLGSMLLAPLAAALLWQIGANCAGMIKAGSVIPSIPAAPQVVHLSDATLIYSQDPVHNVLLETGCPREGGGLTQRTRDAIGFRSIRMEDLPENYIFAGAVTGESTACHERIYRELTADMVRIDGVQNTLVDMGIWKRGK